MVIKLQLKGLVRLMVVAFATSALHVNAEQLCPGLLFSTGFDRQPGHGSVDSLIHAANQGQSIRIRWEIDFNKDGTADLAHWADAAFVSVYAGKVFAQLESVHRQSARRISADMTLRDPWTEWTGLLGSNGTLQGKFSDGSPFPDDLSVRITWCQEHTNHAPGWVMLYKNGVDGKDLKGSKKALFAAIRAGLPIQMGWGFSLERDGNTYSVEQLISPVFLSIVNGSEVSAQLPEHIAQRRYTDIDNALFDNPSVMWRGVMTTRGTFDAVWVDRASGETIRRLPQRTAITWYAPSSAPLDAPTLAMPEGVILDEARADERFPQ